LVPFRDIFSNPDRGAFFADPDVALLHVSIANTLQAKKEKKKTASDLRKAKKDRMLRRKRGEEVFTDDEL
jgi:elongation factor 3